MEVSEWVLAPSLVDWLTGELLLNFALFLHFDEALIVELIKTDGFVLVVYLLGEIRFKHTGLAVSPPDMLAIFVWKPRCLKFAFQQRVEVYILEEGMLLDSLKAGTTGHIRDKDALQQSADILVEL